MKKHLAFLCCLLLAAPAARADDSIRQSMTVSQAYSAIPHQKTRFDPATATMPERELLDVFFGLTDLAVAERVIEQRAITGGQAYVDNYDAILAKLAALDVPPKMQKAYDLITQAVREQREYLARVRGGEKFNANAPLVESSHQKLVAAYGILMQAYPNEDAHNKQAFFDHLCALDFK
ncbi:MAG: hypothetical protein GC185_13080 [Alphaproteobacteria bacterium]|nr:hypothetical protein [Alphaproteobacteria bacterium]